MLVAVVASAQFSGPGYYRVQNAGTHSYMCIKGTHFEKKMTPDAFWPCVLMQKDSAQVTDPGSIIYIPSMGETSLCGQGVSTYSMTGLMLNVDTAQVREEGKPTYIATTEYYDEKFNDTIYCIFRDRGNGFTAGTKEKTESRWWIEPVSEESMGESYFAVKPASEAIKDAEGWYWATLCCDFPVMIPAEGGVEGAYTVQEVTVGSDGLCYAVAVKVYGQGETVPGATPVLLKCRSAYASDGKLIPVGQVANNTTFPVVKDLLHGNYFSVFTNYGSLSDKNVMIDYYPAQSTLASANDLALGVDEDGKLGFFPQDEGTYMAANSAWLSIAGLDLDGVTAVYLTEEATEPEVQAGDVDGDGAVEVSDISVLIDFLLGSETVVPDRDVNMKGADVDGDGVVGISDVSALIDMLLYAEPEF